MKKYTVIDNETKDKFQYSRLQWNLAWVLVFSLGILLGILF
jgi:hypothetical protein